MSTHEAVLELAMRARDMTAGAFADVAAGMDRTAGRVAGAAGRIGQAFSGTGRSLSVGLGSAVDSLVTGGGIGEAMITLGGFMAGELTETFAESAISRLASTSLITMITAPIATIGSSIGAVITAAIPAGMIGAPAIIIGAIVVALGALIVSEDIRNTVFGFVGGLIGWIVDAIGGFVGTLVKAVGDAFQAAWDFILEAVPAVITAYVGFWLGIPARLIGLGAAILETIIEGLSALPGRVADLIGDAFRNLRIDIGPFHITGQGITIDLPQIELPHFAEGVIGFRGGLAVVGEKGPELVRLPAGSDVIPNNQIAAAASSQGVFIEGVSLEQIMDMVDRGLYFRLRAAAPTAVRS